jgi:probable HAF family extracellular repeat protein
VAYAVNATSQVVGYSRRVADATTHAFLWQNGVMQDLGTLGGTISEAFAINSAGQAVGDSYIAGNAAVHAFLWSNGQMYDLNLLIPPGSGWTLGLAYGINDAGAIVGEGTFNGATRAFLLVTGSSIAGTAAIDAAPVVGATVKLKNRVTGDSVTIDIGPAGAYEFQPVDPSTYKITIKTLTLLGAGTVSGTLTVNGAPSAGNRVKLKNRDTGARTTTTTDAGGVFSFADVAAGPYRLNIPKVTVP